MLRTSKKLLFATLVLSLLSAYAGRPPATRAAGGETIAQDDNWIFNMDGGGSYGGHWVSPHPWFPSDDDYNYVEIQYVVGGYWAPVSVTATFDPDDPPPDYLITGRSVQCIGSGGSPSWDNPPPAASVQVTVKTQINASDITEGSEKYALNVSCQVIETLEKISDATTTTRDYREYVDIDLCLYRTHFTHLGDMSAAGWVTVSASKSLAADGAVEIVPDRYEFEVYSENGIIQVAGHNSLGAGDVWGDDAFIPDSEGRAKARLVAPLSAFVKGQTEVTDTVQVQTKVGEESVSGAKKDYTIRFCRLTSMQGNIQRKLPDGSLVPLTYDHKLAPGDVLVMDRDPNADEAPSMRLSFADGKTANVNYIHPTAGQLPVTLGEQHVSGPGVNTFSVNGRDINRDANNRDAQYVITGMRAAVGVGLYLTGYGLAARVGVGAGLWLLDYATRPDLAAAHAEPQGASTQAAPLIPQGDWGAEAYIMGDGAIVVENRGPSVVVDHGGGQVVLPPYTTLTVVNNTDVPPVQGLARDNPTLKEPLVLSPTQGTTVDSVTPVLDARYPWALELDDADMVMRLDGGRVLPEQVDIFGATGRTIAYRYEVPPLDPLTNGDHKLEAHLLTPSGRVIDEAVSTFSVDALLGADGSLQAFPGQTSIGLRWQPVAGTDVAGYKLGRSVDGGAWVTLNAQPLAEAAYLDSSPPAGTAYRYRLAVVDGQGRAGPFSDPVETELAGASPALSVVHSFDAKAAERAIALSFAPGGSGAYAWRLERATAAGGPYAEILLLTDWDLGYLDTAVTMGTSYWYRLTPLGADNQTTAYSQAGPVSPEDAAPVAPTGLTRRGGKETILLEWDPAREPDVTGFRVYRRVPGGDWVLRTPSDLTVTQLSEQLALSKTYAWQVTAVDGVGHESEGSRLVEAAARRDDTPLSITAEARSASGTSFDGGTVEVTPLPDPATFGSQVRLRANPASGFTFAGWAGGATGSDNPLTVTLSDDLAVEALFAVKPHPDTLAVTTVATESARFYDIAADAAGNLYASDQETHSILKIAPNDTVTTLAGTGVAGFADGPGSVAQFSSPRGLVVDGAGNVYVSDWGNHRIRKVAPDGMTSTFVGKGVAASYDGTGTNATTNAPVGMAIDGSGNLYITDRKYRVRRISPGAVVTTIYDHPVEGYNPLIRQPYQEPSELAVSSGGKTIYVLSLLSHAVRRLEMTGDNTAVMYPLAGGDREGAPVSGLVDGLGETARFYRPEGLALAVDGSLYVADTMNNRLRHISPTGYVSTIAGATSYPGHMDGVNAVFDRPQGLGLGSDGTLYVAEGSHIRRVDVTISAQITPAGGTLTIPTSTGSMTASFPAGATSVPLNLTWSLGDPGLLPGDKAAVSPAFHLEARKAGGGLVTQFAKPWTLTVEASGRPVDPGSLELRSWNEGSQSWNTLPATVNSGAKSASAALDHLSQFVLMGELATDSVYLPMVLRGQ